MHIELNALMRLRCENQDVYFIQGFRSGLSKVHRTDTSLAGPIAELPEIRERGGKGQGSGSNRPEGTPGLPGCPSLMDCETVD